MAALRYGENPHQRAALYSGWQRDGRGRGAAAAGQGAELQQHRRPGRVLGAGAASSAGAGGGRDHQAHEPVRGRDRRLPCSRRTGARWRPTRSRLSAGSSASIARWTARLPRRSRSCSWRPSLRRRSRAEALARFAAKKNLRLLGDRCRRRTAADAEAGLRRAAGAGRGPAARHGELN